MFLSKVLKTKKIIKPWGHEVVWAKSSGDEGYLAKIIFIKSGHRLSLQFHEKKEETILVKSGTLTIESIGRVIDKNNIKEMLLNKQEITLSPGDVFHVSKFMSHRFSAKDEDVEIIEVSTKYDDVIRIEDDYGRANFEDNIT